MILRNGVRSIFRARKLCILFLFLTGILSLVLNLGIGVYMSASGTLASFRETYRSVGRIEYIGPDYPDETVYDPFAAAAYEHLDLEGIQNTEGVIFAEKKNFTLGFAEGFKRHRSIIPFRDYGVLLLNSLHPLEETPVDVPLEGVPDFPDTYILINAVTRSRTIHQGESTEVLPAYVYNFADRSFTENIYENGEFSQQVRSPDEIAENYVLITPESERVFYNGSLDPEDRSIPCFVYDPMSDRYSSQTYRVSEYTAVFNEALYSRKEERKILIRLETGTLDFAAQEKHRYAVHGSFIDAGTSNLVFEVREFSDDPDFPIMDITDLDTEELNRSVFGKYAEKYRTANNYINVYSSRDVSLLEPFHQGWLNLEAGRFPDEYEEGVCVIDHGLADQLQLSPGDVLPLSLLKSEQDDIYRFAGSSAPQSYEIIGITTENNDYEGEVFISSKEPFDTGFFGCQAGYVLFENENARSSAEYVEALLEEGMRITLYDQGYETNSEPLKALLGTSGAVTAIASLAAAASLVLFAFLYIYRQSETLAILHDLGLKNRGIREWILSGVLSVVLIGSLAGSICGGLLQSFITSLTLKGTASLYASDTRYSEAAVGLNKTAEIILPDPFMIALFCVAGILLAAVILSLFFLQLTMRQARPRKGVQKIAVPEMKTSVKGKGILRYGRIGFERGGKRSAAVILICFVLSLLLCGFAAVDTNRHKEIENLYENTEIRGSIVSLNGRYSSGLIISENLVRRFNQTGMISSFHVSYGRNRWWRKGEMPQFANTSYGEESREAWIGKQPKLIFTDSLEAAEDLLYVPDMIEWKEGYDESFLHAEYPQMTDNFAFDKKTGKRIMIKAVPALVPKEYLKDEWNDAGEIEIESDSGVLKLIPAGVYTETSRRPGIYLPLPLIYDLKNLYEEPDDSRSYYKPETVFTSGSFTLKSSHDLSAFKDFLEKNRYSAVNDPKYDRTTVLLYDGSFLDTLNTLNRNLSFIRMIYPVLMGFTVLIGFLISWLMINGRRMDFAVMKGLGTGRWKIFLIFFLEQAYAALVGILPVLILSFFISKPLIILLFAVSYLLGTALSIRLAARENLLVLLSEKE